jgi:hypothetical protein
MAIATILLFVASLIADCFVYGQWTAALNAQKDNRLQQSADVTFMGGTQIANDKNGTTINYVFAPRYHNWGGTRTGYFSGWTSVQYFDKEIPNSQDFTKPYKLLPFNATTIGANADAEQFVSLSAADAVKAKNKEGIAVIWGHADWSTIYEPAKTYSVSFCLELVPVSSEGDNHILFSFRPLKAGCNTGMSPLHE